ncbi:hypothetical protein [Flagellimonas pacifica]|uniref:PepSY domain-containing protein n=1 Tax=Flagellimonas pacifica TaxID=1247520 RepID=A0A285MC20_9FLAO|nr:hypothetical protein [Allomuricauda parva]SNY94679.1 hypothetical protein SAMN06265377_0339 [Allomuricauda parva]
MTKRKFIQLNRKWHRYLGAVLGIQFLLWTLGGLYFSWTNIDEIRGDNLKQSKPSLSISDDFVSPSTFLNTGFTSEDNVQSLELTTILTNPIYRVVLKTTDGVKVKLYNAKTGKQRLPLTEDEAVQIAKEGLKISANLTNVEYLTETGKHHEYRGRPLPAYAITFAKPANTTIYVSPEHGNIQTFRSNKWRVFDFFWMLHTMDYEGRDDFNNLLLRAFAFFGLFTIFSGFSLFIITSKTIQKSFFRKK